VPERLRTPEYWRERAAEARTLAESMKDPQSKRAMLNVAASYENVAKRAQARRLGKGR